MLLSNNASGNYVDADGILLVPNLGSEPGPANVKTEVATADVPIGTLDASTTNTVSAPKPQAQAQTKAATTAPATVAISGVSGPAPVHVVYNQGTPTSTTAAPADLVDAALGTVTPTTATRKQTAKSKTVVHGHGSANHGAFRSRPTHNSGRLAPQITLNKVHAVAVPQRAGVDGRNHQPRA